jgi:hypothetical protein
VHFPVFVVGSRLGTRVFHANSGADQLNRKEATLLDYTEVHPEKIVVGETVPDKNREIGRMRRRFRQVHLSTVENKPER